MRFSDIPGHAEEKQRLRQMADSERIPHAILLEGPVGTGKFALARAFAQYLHCTQRTPDGEPCGCCQSCRQHQSFNHIDTFFVFPVVKSEKSTTPPVSDDYIDQWRKYISDNLYLSPQEWAATFSKKNARPTYYVPQSTELIRRMSITANSSKYKVVLLWQPEAMPAPVANKMLKLIEEPFGDTKFIMISENPREILPTIYSRLQRIGVRRIPDSDIAAHLRGKYGLPDDEALALAHIADGSMVAADTLMSESGSRHDYLERFISLMRLAYQRKVAELRDWAFKLADTGREYEIHFYEYAVRMMRENFVYNLNAPEITYLNVEENMFSSKFARFITANNVERLISHFEKAAADIAANGNGKMINFDVALKVILLIKNA